MPGHHGRIGEPTMQPSAAPSRRPSLHSPHILRLFPAERRGRRRTDVGVANGAGGVGRQTWSFPPTAWSFPPDPGPSPGGKCSDRGSKYSAPPSLRTAPPHGCPSAQAWFSAARDGEEAFFPLRAGSQSSKKGYLNHFTSLHRPGSSPFRNVSSEHHPTSRQYGIRRRSQAYGRRAAQAEA
jgi:hypothetical protein